jgi:hypothetical protein
MNAENAAFRTRSRNGDWDDVSAGLSDFTRVFAFTIYVLLADRRLTQGLLESGRSEASVPAGSAIFKLVPAAPHHATSFLPR